MNLPIPERISRPFAANLVAIWQAPTVLEWLVLLLISVPLLVFAFLAIFVKSPNSISFGLYCSLFLMQIVGVKTERWASQPCTFAIPRHREMVLGAVVLIAFVYSLLYGFFFWPYRESALSGPILCLAACFFCFGFQMLLLLLTKLRPEFAGLLPILCLAGLSFGRSDYLGRIICQFISANRFPIILAAALLAPPLFSKRARIWLSELLKNAQRDRIDLRAAFCGGVDRISVQGGRFEAAGLFIVRLNLFGHLWRHIAAKCLLVSGYIRWQHAIFLLVGFFSLLVIDLYVHGDVFLALAIAMASFGFCTQVFARTKMDQILLQSRKSRFWAQLLAFLFLQTLPILASCLIYMVSVRYKQLLPSLSFDGVLYSPRQLSSSIVWMPLAFATGYGLIFLDGAPAGPDQAGKMTGSGILTVAVMTIYIMAETTTRFRIGFAILLSILFLLRLAHFCWRSDIFIDTAKTK